MLIFSQARWNSWGADVQRAIREVMPQAIAEGLKFHDDFTADSVRQMRERGITVVDPPIGPWREVTRRSYDAILNDSGAGGRALFQEIEAARRSA